ncbi:uncharacterized protein MYCFIDRAFT_86942 [Pseudocercospora fijiensis CIRAD86]|uniref:Low temperature requirement A n=1 Tax=Pseudocercospora fijiensis (strain CIRAD86) TaxID=383855 RepID=M3A2L7_PSEFD|nr:uncharacterized protein MYCFIDRAFT_86942 [Pseudocercospora fijiensis CIRAD86]EME78636.1 hypothetical protein MYCFIDRAFT_86942 [Pseudocercospora fijiensis CIRAD86]
MRDNNSVSTLLPVRSPRPSDNVSRAQTPTRSSNDGGKMEPLQCEDTSRRPSIHENPELHRHTEASNLELFYDLFFAANLTVFSNIHEVTNSATLKQYVGFFCILWLTWYQVGLYDVRFSVDSIFERVAKAVQFLVMIGFAIVGPKYSVGRAHEGAGDEEVVDGAQPSLGYYFKALTLFLMASRLVLVFQYTQSMWLTRQYKQTILPMSLIATTYFVAAMVYLGLFWTFHKDGHSHYYVVWYLVAILESIIATMVSAIWKKAISFKGTHLIERMSLLTLIILGEGVVSLASKCQRIVKSEGALKFTTSTVANVVCCVLILYFVYMIYFDWLEEEHFGNIMQQIWSLLHFPLHIALVLAVEGMAQCITWRAAVVRSNHFVNQYQDWNNLISQGNFAEAGRRVNKTATKLLHRGLLVSKNLKETLELIPDIPNAANASRTIANGANNTALAGDALDWIYFTLFKTIFNIAGFDSPIEGKTDIDAELTESSDALKMDFADENATAAVINATSRTAGVFGLTYGYFFISIGLVVILCCVIAGLSKRTKSRLQLARLIASSVIGCGLCLLATLGNTSAGTDFAFSPWLLPTVTLALGVVVVLNSVKPAVPKTGMLGFRKG